MIPSTPKELARITALEELVDTANRLLHEQGCELETAQTRISELETENARLQETLKWARYLIGEMELKGSSAWEIKRGKR